MVGNSYSQMVVSISTFLMILMFIPDFKKRPFFVGISHFSSGHFHRGGGGAHIRQTQSPSIPNCFHLRLQRAIWCYPVGVLSFPLSSQFSDDLHYSFSRCFAAVVSLWFCLGALGSFDCFLGGEYDESARLLSGWCSSSVERSIRRSCNPTSPRFSHLQLFLTRCAPVMAFCAEAFSNTHPRTSGRNLFLLSLWALATELWPQRSEVQTDRFLRSTRIQSSSVLYGLNTLNRALP